MRHGGMPARPAATVTACAVHAPCGTVVHIRSTRQLYLAGLLTAATTATSRTPGSPLPLPLPHHPRRPPPCPPPGYGLAARTCSFQYHCHTVHCCKAFTEHCILLWTSPELLARLRAHQHWGQWIRDHDERGTCEATSRQRQCYNAARCNRTKRNRCGSELSWTTWVNDTEYRHRPATSRRVRGYSRKHDDMDHSRLFSAS